MSITVTQLSASTWAIIFAILSILLAFTLWVLQRRQTHRQWNALILTVLAIGAIFVISVLVAPQQVTEPNGWLILLGKVLVDTVTVASGLWMLGDSSSKAAPTTTIQAEQISTAPEGRNIATDGGAYYESVTADVFNAQTQVIGDVAARSVTIQLRWTLLSRHKRGLA